MDVDLTAASAFVTGSARVLDRRRFDLLLGRGDRGAVLAALDGYANPDGGYGWGLEPDLRAPESQPAGAMHALEVLAEAADPDEPRAPALLSWLERTTLPDGGLPFALPVRDPTACAPFWVGADPTASSLQTTSQVAAQAHRLARVRPDVAGSDWLRTATDHCTAVIRGLRESPIAHELLFAVRFADAVPEPDELIERLRRFVPEDGAVPVAGGSPGEALHPLDLSPEPDAPSRRLFAAGVVEADLARLAAAQQPDGGWPVDFASYSPAATVEWRGYATVAAVAVLRGNGVV
ncbi:hypothetical protein ACI797_21815 [Geodermatophilus sp. SYSU D00691]